MRVNKIIIKNMGPFKDTTIDYTKAGSNGVVLIAGDTGSGKSTFYDAITYALYGDTSGKERRPEMLHNITEKGHETMSVDFTFTEKGKKYRVYRYRQASCSGNYTKMQLFYIDESGKEVEETKRSGLGGKDTSVQDILEQEILHMKYDQFVKCAMLAQGKFREILTDEKHRGTVLAGLFKTGKLTRLVDKIKGEKNAVDAKVEVAKRDLENALQDIRYTDEQEAEYAFLEKDAFYLDLEGNEEALEKLLKEEIGDLAKLDKEIKNMLDSIQEKSSLLEKAKTYAQDKKDLDDAKAALPAAETEYNTAENTLKAAEAEKNKEAEYTLEIQAKDKVLTDLEGLPNLKKTWDDLVEQKNNKSEDLKKVDAKVYELEKANIAEQERLEKLPNYGQMEAELQAKEQCLKQVEKAVEAASQQEQVVCEAIKSVQKAKQPYEKAEKAKADTEKVKLEVEEAWNKSNELEKDKGKLVAEKTPLDQLAEQLENRTGLLADKKDKQDKYDEDKLVYEEELNAYFTDYRIFMNNQAGILALELDEAEYCPVCGAAHAHFGQRATLQEHVKSEAEINSLREYVEGLGRALNQEAGAIGNLGQAIEGLEKEISEKAKLLQLEGWSGYEKLTDLLQEKISGLEDAIKTLEAEIAAKQSIYKSQKNVEACIKAFEKADDNFKKQEKAYNEATELYGRESALLTGKRKDEIQALADQGYLIMDEALKTALDNYGTDAFAQEDKDVIAGALKTGLEEMDKADREIVTAKSGLKTDKDKAEKDKQALVEAQKELEELKKQLLELKKAIAGLEPQEEAAKKAYEDKAAELASFDKDQVAQDKEALEQKIADNQEALEKAQKSKEDKGNKVAGLKKSIELKDKATKGVALPAPEVVEADLQGLRNKSEAMSQAFTTRSENLAMNKNAKTKIKKALKEYRENKQRLEVLKPLADFIGGKESGGNKVDLATFAQGYYLDQVVIAANVILRKLSKHRYFLKRRTERTKTQDKVVTGLQLQIYDSWNGTYRDVKSMSGGEGFMASMALALGLAEVTKRQHGATAVESLFIDEGFGTLDAASLEQIMDLLNDLSGSKNASGEEKSDSEKRMVTIISHLDELGKSVSKQFVIEKSPNGSTVKYRDLNLEHY